MPLYKVHLNHVYEDDEHVEVEADNEQEAYDKAQNEGNVNTAYDHAQHTSTTVLEVEEINNG
jgi:hypothetical protein